MTGRDVSEMTEAFVELIMDGIEQWERGGRELLERTELLLPLGPEGRDVRWCTNSPPSGDGSIPIDRLLLNPPCEVVASRMTACAVALAAAAWI